nr:hypothetical protein CFP56_16587 [Quercus suber]
MTNVPGTSPRPQVLGIHHLNFAVSNLDISLAWYERVLGASRIAALDHLDAEGTRLAAVCHVPDWNGLYVELRQLPLQAEKDRCWDPVTLTVQGKDDLVHWIDWLRQWGTVHSPVLTGLRGWLLIFEVR